MGLGNPGPEYDRTPHNAGFWFVDEVARVHGGVFRNEARFHGEVCKTMLSGQPCWLLKPATYMNRSGQSVAALAHYYRVDTDAILVAHDELDFPPGQVRLKTGGGHGGHNGLRDIIPALGGRDFHRLRIGVGHPGHGDQVTGHLLGRVNKDDVSLIDQAIQQALDVVPMLIAGKLQDAMKALHTD